MDISASQILPDPEVALKLFLALAAGGMIGLDRELRERSAGLRTHMMTALAAALFTLLTFEIYRQLDGAAGASGADPLRLIEAVTLGVSFLAAGAIIRRPGEVHGLTTGATIWLAGALGTAAGAGLYQLLLLGTFFGLLVMVLVRLVERVVLNTK